MFCPECHTEYLEGYKVCADCNVTLVDERPLEEPLKEIRWVALPPVNGRIYAEMVSEVMDQQQIPHYIKADILTSSYNISSADLLGSTVVLYVPEDRHQEAEELLKELMG